MTTLQEAAALAIAAAGTYVALLSIHFAFGG